MTFGPHLTLDIKGYDKEKMTYERIFNFLQRIPGEIGMTAITQPYVFPYSGLVPEDKGITGIAIIAESHISVHTFELKDYVFIDIFSCKPFDTERAINLISEEFGTKSMTVNIVER